VAFLVQRGGDAGRLQVTPQILDVPLIEHVAVVGMVQDVFDLVQQHPIACPLDGFHAGAQMMQQRFDFTPVDVAANRVMEDRADQVFVLVAHALPHAAWGADPKRSRAYNALIALLMLPKSSSAGNHTALTPRTK